MSHRDVREFKCDRCGKTIYGERDPDGLGYDISGIRDWRTATLIGDLCSDCWEAYKNLIEEFKNGEHDL